MPASIFAGMGTEFLGALKEANTATFKPLSGPQAPVSVIFNDKYQDLDADGLPYGSPRPVMFFRTGDFTPAHGGKDKIEINGREYTIRSVEPDGHEMTKAELSYA